MFSLRHHQENLSIKRLNLSWNGFGNEGALAMAEALKFNSTLQWLDMSNNRVTNEGAFMLAKGVEINDSIKVLKVSSATKICVTMISFNNTVYTGIPETLTYWSPHVL